MATATWWRKRSDKASNTEGVPFPIRPVPFLLRYVRLRPWMHVGLIGIAISGAACSVAVQYGMKLIVDGMAGANNEGHQAVWFALSLFVGLIAIENILWRLSGWLGCRTVVAAGVDIRLDVFNHPAA